MNATKTHLPRGDWQVWGMSPDGARHAAHDPRLLGWLKDHGISAENVYRVRMWNRVALVFQYANPRRMMLYSDGPKRRWPQWVWNP